jgi:hypothetical protein
MTRALLLLFALALAACDQTAKDAELRTLVGRYLDYYAGAYGGGMQPAGPDQIAPLTEGQAHTVDLDLQPGLEYRFIGACDNECIDIDLRLVNVTSQEVVGLDNLADNFPLVVYTPPEPGRYQVTLLMYGCTIQPCYAGVRMVAGAPAAPAQ